MVVVIFMVVIGIVLVTVFVVVGLRSWVQQVNRTEAELHAPGVRTLSYAVPPGRDPAHLLAALDRAGFHAIEEDPTTLLVACPGEGDADKIRHLLETA